MPNTDTTPISARFKSGCWDLHQSAETGRTAQRMIKGELTRAEYTELVRQAYPAHKRLDDLLREHREEVPALANLITDEQFHAPRYADDLRFLDIDPDSITPSPATQALIDHAEQLARQDPLLLLALHYVREGANNGNRFVAMKLRAALGFDGPAGTTHLDPYAEHQPQKWAEFKKTLDEQDLTPEQVDALVETARSMFQAIIDMHREAETASAT